MQIQKQENIKDQDPAVRMGSTANPTLNKKNNLFADDQESTATIEASPAPREENAP